MGKYTYSRNSGDKLHRLAGPAVEYENGEFTWYKDGKVHRPDGPAMRLMLEDKPIVDLWYFNNVQVDDELRTWAKEMSIDLDNLTEDDKNLMMIKFNFG